MRNNFERLRDDAERIKFLYCNVNYPYWLNRVGTLAFLAIKKDLFDEQLRGSYLKFDNAERSQRINLGRKLLDDIVKYARSQLDEN